MLAAFIPFLAGFQDPLAAALEPRLDLLPAVAIALLGVAVVVLEGLQHLSQYHQNWLSYRATREALKREKFLFPADAGPYGAVEDKRALLAERTEELIGKEHAQRCGPATRVAGAPPSRRRGCGAQMRLSGILM